jgi:uncharacterized phage protein (TIGR02218 family)
MCGKPRKFGTFENFALQVSMRLSQPARMEVADHSVSGETVTIMMLEAPVRPMAIGDTFVICAGCDKRLETCRAKFANVANFRGFPHIPGQDAVIRYASRDGGHEGAVL